MGFSPFRISPKKTCFGRGSRKNQVEFGFQKHPKNCEVLRRKGSLPRSIRGDLERRENDWAAAVACVR